MANNYAEVMRLYTLFQTKTAQGRYEEAFQALKTAAEQYNDADCQLTNNKE